MDGTKEKTSHEKTPAHEGEWGSLPNEPCMFCNEIGGIRFLIDEGPEGRAGLETVRCEKCGRSWNP